MNASEREKFNLSAGRLPISNWLPFYVGSHHCRGDELLQLAAQ